MSETTPDPAREIDSNLAGKLLIAMPNIGDPRFERAVILMCLHDDTQAMGLILNKPKSELTLGDVFDHLNIRLDGAEAAALKPRPVLDGGPVKPDRGYVLHSPDFAAGATTQTIGPGLRLTATRDVLEAMASASPPSKFVLALGYSGWGPGQLEQELAANAWLVTDAEPAIVFDQTHADKWTRAVRALGLDAIKLPGAAGRA
jgi:putative transcriptional regulator